MKKKIKAWALVDIDGDIPDFSVLDKFDNVYNIHENKEDVEKIIKEIGGGWKVAECEIIIKSTN